MTVHFTSHEEKRQPFVHSLFSELQDKYPEVSGVLVLYVDDDADSILLASNMHPSESVDALECAIEMAEEKLKNALESN